MRNDNTFLYFYMCFTTNPSTVWQTLSRIFEVYRTVRTNLVLDKQVQYQFSSPAPFPYKSATQFIFLHFARHTNMENGHYIRYNHISSLLTLYTLCDAPLRDEVNLQEPALKAFIHVLGVQRTLLRYNSINCFSTAVALLLISLPARKKVGNRRHC